MRNIVFDALEDFGNQSKLVPGFFLVKVKLIEVFSAEDHRRINIEFVRRNGEKKFITSEVIDQNMKGASKKWGANEMYSALITLMETLGLHDFRRMVENKTARTSTENDSPTTSAEINDYIQEAVGKEALVGLYVRVDEGIFGACYDYKILKTFDVHGRTLDEAKYNDNRKRTLLRFYQRVGTVRSLKFRETNEHHENAPMNVEDALRILTLEKGKKNNEQKQQIRN